VSVDRYMNPAQAAMQLQERSTMTMTPTPLKNYFFFEENGRKEVK